MKELSQKRIIYILAFLIPAGLLVLFGIKIDGYNLNFLAHITTSLNALTSILLIAALIAVKNKNIALHEKLIKICLAFSLIFLVLYGIRHMTSPEVKYGDINGDGILSAEELALVASSRIWYFVLLASHIFLSVFVVPLVLFSYMYGRQRNIVKHKKIVRFAFPIWLYVCVTGVVVYFMISPYY